MTPGYAIGGLSVENQSLSCMRCWIIPFPLCLKISPGILWALALRLSGGRVLHGIDMFDCVLPTHCQKRHCIDQPGKIVVRNAEHAKDFTTLIRNATAMPVRISQRLISVT